jgi:hypothetical protein
MVKVAQFQLIIYDNNNMHNGFDYTANRDALERVMDANEKLHEEMDKENPNGSKITQLMFEQLLRGMFIQQM